MKLQFILLFTFSPLLAMQEHHTRQEQLCNRRMGSSLSIWHAAATGNIPDLKQYIEQGCDASIQNSVGETPLMFAIRMKHKNAVQLLIDEGVDLEQVNKKGETALIVALNHGKKKIVAKLIDSGADVNTACISGLTPLHIAVMNGNVESTQKLLESGADVNAQDNFHNRTALLHAIRMTQGSVEKTAPQNSIETTIKIVQLLLDHNANTLITDNEKRNALYWAKWFKMQPLVELLEKKTPSKNAHIEASAPHRNSKACSPVINHQPAQARSPIKLSQDQLSNIKSTLKTFADNPACNISDDIIKLLERKDIHEGMDLDYRDELKDALFRITYGAALSVSNQIAIIVVLRHVLNSQRN